MRRIKVKGKADQFFLHDQRVVEQKPVRWAQLLMTPFA
jgi:hypothetical protein